MALSNLTVLEQESGGSDTNGGGFVAGTAGTIDYSQQPSAQVAVTDAVAVGTTTVTSASAAFTSQMVNNLLYLAGGSGSVAAGRYQVMTYVNATTVTVDRSVAAGTGITANLGGCFATKQAMVNAVTTADMACYTKGNETISTQLTFPTLSPSKYQTRLIGYTAVRGDEGQVTVTCTGAINGITNGQQGWTLENLAFVGNGSTALVGILANTQYLTIYNCKVSGFTSYGINATTSSVPIIRCEATSCSGTAGISTNGSSDPVFDSFSHDNTCAGFSDNGGGQGGSYFGCVSTNNTGANSDGFILNYGGAIIGCLSYGSGRDGLRLASNLAFGIATVVRNSLFAKNGGYGVNWTTAGPTTKFGWFDYNGYWSNTSGAVNNVTLGTHDVVISGSSPTNDPFVSDSTGNFALNSTAGAGALLRAAGFPGTWGSTTGYRDIGPFQHQDPPAGPVGSSKVIQAFGSF